MLTMLNAQDPILNPDFFLNCPPLFPAYNAPVPQRGLCLNIYNYEPNRSPTHPPHRLFDFPRGARGNPASGIAARREKRIFFQKIEKGKTRLSDHGTDRASRPCSRSTDRARDPN